MRVCAGADNVSANTATGTRATRDEVRVRRVIPQPSAMETPASSPKFLRISRVRPKPRTRRVQGRVQRFRVRLNSYTAEPSDTERPSAAAKYPRQSGANRRGKVVK